MEGHNKRKNREVGIPAQEYVEKNIPESGAGRPELGSLVERTRKRGTLGATAQKYFRSIVFGVSSDRKISAAIEHLDPSKKLEKEKGGKKTGPNGSTSSLEKG